MAVLANSPAGNKTLAKNADVKSALDRVFVTTLMPESVVRWAMQPADEMESTVDGIEDDAIEAAAILTEDLAGSSDVD
jgi:hypothetical protein